MVRDAELVTFTPRVSSAMGGMATEATSFYSKSVVIDASVFTSSNRGVHLDSVSTAGSHAPEAPDGRAKERNERQQRSQAIVEL